MNKAGIAALLVGVLACAVPASAGEQVVANTGVDVVSRYVWRGLDIASTPSLQPTFSVSVAHIELGAWGAYTLSNNASASDEIDFWLSYSLDLENGASISPIITDYYFPNAGVSFFNFNNHDATTSDGAPDPGAHTVELGVTASGPESFPISVAAFVNIYNDAGNNTYFQADYPVALPGADLNFFCGATLGSKENPGYYGTDNFSVINLGVTAAKVIGNPDGVSVPLFVTWIINPKAEISHLVVGASF